MKSLRGIINLLSKECDVLVSVCEEAIFGLGGFSDKVPGDSFHYIYGQYVSYKFSANAFQDFLSRNKVIDGESEGYLKDNDFLDQMSRDISAQNNAIVSTLLFQEDLDCVSGRGKDLSAVFEIVERFSKDVRDQKFTFGSGMHFANVAILSEIKKQKDKYSSFDSEDENVYTNDSNILNFDKKYNTKKQGLRKSYGKPVND